MRGILLSLTFIATSLSVAAQSKYVVVDLGSAGGTSVQTSANSINNAGQVAGSSNNADYSTYRAYRTAPNSPINPATDLIPLPAGATYNYVDTNSLNNSGQVAFDAGLSDGFRLDADGTVHDLANLGGVATSNAWAINDSGQVTGQADLSLSYADCLGVDSFPAFRTEPDSVINPSTDNLGTLLAGAIPVSPYSVSGCRYAIGTAINSSGQVVGYSAGLNASYSIYGLYQLYFSIYNPEQHAMLATPGAPMQDLGLLGGTATASASQGRHATAYAINDAGQIVGESTYNGAPNPYATHAFLTSAAGPMRDLGTLGGNYSSASGINSSGQIVGYATTAGDAADDGFLYTGGTMYDLNSLITPGSASWQIVSANAINDSGQIAATAWENGVPYVSHPVRLDPVDVAVTILTNLLSDPTLGLTTGQIASLTDKLNNALASIQSDLNKQAINQLDAFINSVQSSVKTGKISAQTGNALTSNASTIAAAL